MTLDFTPRRDIRRGVFFLFWQKGSFYHREKDKKLQTVFYTKTAKAKNISIYRRNLTWPVVLVR